MSHNSLGCGTREKLYDLISISMRRASIIPSDMTMITYNINISIK